MTAAPDRAGAKPATRGAGTPGRRPAFGHPRLSQLLVLTMVAMAVLLCVRVPPALHAMIGARPGTPMQAFGEAEAALIEPAAGPVPSAAGGPATMTAVQELAAELAGREQALARREQAFAVKEAAFALIEQRIDERSEALEALRAAADALVGEVSAEDAARTAQLARVYEAMKPRSAAAILDELGLELVVPIVKGMRDAKVSAIVAAMAPDKARALTAELARKRAAELPR